MFTRLLCGLYYNISKDRHIQFGARVYCVLCVVFCTRYFYLIAQVNIMRHNLESLLITLVTIILYIIYVIISFVYEGEYIHKFRHKLAILDIKLNSRPVDDLQCSFWAFVLVISQRLMSFIILRRSLGPLDFSGLAIVYSSTIVRCAITLSNFTKIIMFECLHRRMKLLGKLVQCDLSVARRFEYGESVMIENLHKCINIYKELLNTMQESKTPMKATVFFMNFY